MEVETQTKWPDNNTTKIDNILSLENPAFSSYLVCVSLLSLKIMGTHLLTIYHRLTTKTCISQEDAAWSGGEMKSNEKVERVRRAVQNDLENIPIFFIISLGYLFIDPQLWAVNTLFIIYFLTRFIHTIVYAVYVVRQPARAIMWMIGFIIIAYMSIHIALYVFINGIMK